MLWHSVKSSQWLWKTSGVKAVDRWLKLTLLLKDERIKVSNTVSKFTYDSLLWVDSIILFECESILVPVIYKSKRGVRD